jgi:hypothetical protein
MVDNRLQLNRHITIFKKIIFIQITLKLGNQAHCLKLGVGRGFSKNAKQ